ncbi:MAG: mechanosensitive ion channel family protein [Gammaproteobacteria bacterium]|uniref:Small-conductance mechanosensitive channel n=1 Tax=Marinomonas polaris DSM 16579 TaxID=1122206 RepID=A0A1M5GSM4_9GAMM|nr:mechanosensitive ion channel domain-containing protein [Marinomonas polaris]MBU1296163.1 mechanosensitive ion channel family protein [Gammaproteobacteria bacterium]MBU1465345.1 mechanosensitive ion channel family protein [Gammaproteobacteria bacterium]MBU2023586.1 mechanosensitive ion channel family protein [Gammaproteobacteria bacterium]MBU2237365.1 mechanosensitive ion channel family protein [Gammaproteobacteria bacterium]MBU2319155.1 mechanosensitive ion channel family protein [Gammaprot
MPVDFSQLDFSILMDHVEIVLTVAWILLSYIVRRYTKRAIRLHQKTEHDKKRQRINTVDNIFNLLLVVGLVLIWSSELQNIAISIAAFMVALVIATKEFIACIVGAFYRASTRPYQVGDWIRIANYEGEVTDSDWLSTTLFEVDLKGGSYTYTGRTTVVPNSVLLLHTVQNLNYMRRYVTHTFSISRSADDVNLFTIKEQILEKIREYSEHFHDVAIRYNSLIEKRLDIKISGPEPRVRITTTVEGYNVFSISLFCPTDEAVEIEQKVIEDFMIFWYEKRDMNTNTIGEE